MAENFVDLCREFVDTMRNNRRLYEYVLSGAVIDEEEGNTLAKEGLRRKKEIEDIIRVKLRDPYLSDEEKEEGAKLILDYDEEQKKWWRDLGNDARD